MPTMHGSKYEGAYHHNNNNATGPEVYDDGTIAAHIVINLEIPKSLKVILIMEVRTPKSLWNESKGFVTRGQRGR
jgi:hypothetical protein